MARTLGVLIAPKTDAAHRLSAIKDPSVVYHEGRWHVFAGTASTNGSYSMVLIYANGMPTTSASPSTLADSRSSTRAWTPRRAAPTTPCPGAWAC
ncbi:hypothetical protein [Streptomyces sp. NPDC057740]|uniref:hypothetical protein n=1 Tax=Streptomyces sp. NPDC057740 TaxID=3346234 RepID=UPI0036767B8A